MRRGLPGFGADRTECLPLVPDPCQGKPGSQMDICFLDRKDVQFHCHCHQCQEIIVFIHRFVRDKFLVSFADPVIGAVIFQNVPGENRLCFVSCDSGGHDSVCSLNVAVDMTTAMIFVFLISFINNPSIFVLIYLAVCTCVVLVCCGKSIQKMEG